MALTDAATAVAEAVDDGDSVYLAGFGHLVPYALGHEIIRQGPRDLTVTSPVVDGLFDQLIGAGCVSKALFSWTGGPCLERQWRAGDLEIEEYTHYGTVARIYAGARNLPFVPVRTFTGSDLIEHTETIRSVESPYDGEEVPVLPPLQPDVAVIHAQRADEAGNVQIWGLVTDTRDAAYAAETVIVSVEETVGEEVVKSDPNRTAIPSSEVDYLVEEPYGAHPSYAQGYYARDGGYFGWRDLAEDEEAAGEWLDEWVHGVADRGEYLEKVGIEYLLSIRPRARPTGSVNLGEYQ